MVTAGSRSGPVAPGGSTERLHTPGGPSATFPLEISETLPQTLSLQCPLLRKLNTAHFSRDERNSVYHRAHTEGRGWSREATNGLLIQTQRVSKDGDGVQL